MSLHKDKLYNNAIINSFKIKSDSIEVLKESIKIALSTHNTALGFVSTVNVLRLYWKNPNYPNYIKFKKPLDIDNCIEFVYDWLMNIDSIDRITEKNENGENGEYGFGFKISSKGESDYEIFNIKCMNLLYKT